MAVSKKQLEYAKKYHEKFDDIKVRVDKGKKEEYIMVAARCFKTSLNQFIVDAIEEKIKRINPRS